MRTFRTVLPSAAVGAALLAGASGCGQGSGEGHSRSERLVVLDAPVSTSPWIAGFMRSGAELAVQQVNAAGGVPTADGPVRLRLQVMDNAGQPSRALADARRAVEQGALLLLTDGTGVLGAAGLTDAAALPTVILFEGGEQLVDPAVHASVFRMAPEDKPMARRLADYIANDRPRVALLTDDSEYGLQGRQALRKAFTVDEVAVVADEQVPRAGSEVSGQVLAARTAGADRLVVWAGPAVVANTLRAARSSGWQVPVYAGPTGEDPLVRQQLADHPDWVTGLTFASFRITSEVGPVPFRRFRAAYDKAHGPIRTGLTQDGRPVVQPPDWEMFGYDTVRLAAAALRGRPATRRDLLAGLQATTITGANGDERGYGPEQHEGVNPSDVYFGRFDRFVFRPVDDDPLSGTLTFVPQLQ